MAPSKLETICEEGILLVSIAVFWSFPAVVVTVAAYIDIRIEGPQVFNEIEVLMNVALALSLTAFLFLFAVVPYHWCAQKDSILGLCCCIFFGPAMGTLELTGFVVPCFCHGVSVILLAVESGKVDKETATEALPVFAAASSFLCALCEAVLVKMWWFD